MSVHNCDYCECPDELEDMNDEILTFEKLNKQYKTSLEKLNKIIEGYSVPVDVFDSQIKLYMETLNNVVEGRCDRLQIIIKGVTKIYDEKLNSLHLMVEDIKNTNK